MSNCDSLCDQRADATLAAYLSGGRLSHAILVEGNDGTLGFAKKIARAALCDAETEKPCGVCPSCIKVGKDVHPDLLVYSGCDKARSFHVDAVREIRREAFIKPNDGDSRVFILENAQNMTVQAQNALLKIIEEPPRNVTFILTCENKSLLLETLLSRVSVLSFGENAPHASDTETSELAQKARDTLKELLEGSELQVLASFAPFEKDRAGFQNFIGEIRGQAAKMMTHGAKSGQLTREYQYKLIKITEIIDDMERAIAQNVGGLLLTNILSAKFNTFSFASQTC